MAQYVPLIDLSYFDGELTIGQQEQNAVTAELNLFIRRYEVEFLNALMGDALFRAFHAGIKAGSPADKWKRMAYGKTFVLDVNKVKTGVKQNGMLGYIRTPRFEYYHKMQVPYKGLMKLPTVDNFDDFRNLGYGAESPIAQYVYYWYMRKKDTTTGGVTEAKQQVHNAIAASAAQKMVTAWNNMCRTVFHFYLFLDENADDYPEFDLDVNARFAPAPINTFNFL
jgi:hypothetical protein